MPETANALATIVALAAHMNRAELLVFLRQLQAAIDDQIAETLGTD